jgi:hypothetical protein
MRTIFLVAALGLLTAGCFQSDGALYQGTKPLTPFASGTATSRDKDGKEVPMVLTRGKDGRYDLEPKKAGPGSGDIVLLRFFPLTGAPQGILVAEVENCGSVDIKKCRVETNFSYELVRPLPGHVEWRDPDCSKTFSKLAGIAVKIDSCKFTDRASLEKALRVAAAMPWQADGAYQLH